MQVFRISSHFEYPASYHLSDYGDTSSLPTRSYSEAHDYRLQGFSPNSSASSSSTGPSTSLARSSKAASRSPPARQRTPIRHHRPSISRAKGGGRSEALLAYTSQQESQAGLSQQMASSQGNFAPGPYMMPPTSSSYHLQPNYYCSAGMSQQPQDGQYMLTPSNYSVEPSAPTYFGLGRSTSFPLDALPSMQASDPLYPPQLGSNVPSQPWPSSTGASRPSISLAPLTTFSPSSSMDNAEGIRILASRPKPQCFEHGCNGRQFSTFSNLLRHQREKSGSASKAVCPHCGTEFTRTTARNGHLYGGKCKGRDGQGITEPES